MLVDFVFFVFFFFFFFQAEDGIRDTSVTGVQTCALPISRRSPARPRRAPGAKTRSSRAKKVQPRPPVEIGRASCRGKSVDLGGRRIIKKKKKKKEKKQ